MGGALPARFVYVQGSCGRLWEPVRYPEEVPRNYPKATHTRFRGSEFGAADEFSPLHSSPANAGELWQCAERQRSVYRVGNRILVRWPAYAFAAGNAARFLPAQYYPSSRRIKATKIEATQSRAYHSGHAVDRRPVAYTHAGAATKGARPQLAALTQTRDDIARAVTRPEQ